MALIEHADLRHDHTAFANVLGITKAELAGAS